MSLGRDETVISKLDAVCVCVCVSFYAYKCVQLFITVYNVTFHSHVRCSHRRRRHRHRKRTARAGVAGAFFCFFRGSPPFSLSFIYEW